MVTLDELIKDAGRVDNLKTDELDRAFRSVCAAAERRQAPLTADAQVREPRHRVLARVGVGLAATAVVVAAGVGVGNLTGLFAPDPDTGVVAGHDGHEAPDEAIGEEGETDPLASGPFAGVSPGFFEENGQTVWRIYADATAPDVDAQTVPSQFTGAGLDAIYIQLEEFATSSLGEGEFFSHAYDARTDTVHVITNITEERLPSDLVASNVLSYEFASVDPQHPAVGVPSDGDLPTEDD